jgi:hypothetical protein
MPEIPVAGLQEKNSAAVANLLVDRVSKQANAAVFGRARQLRLTADSPYASVRRSRSFLNRDGFCRVVLILSNRAQRREHPMRTYLNVAVTNRNVFGFGQDRVVSSVDTCARAAHRLSRHASHRARKSALALKRRGSDLAAWASTALLVMPMGMTITGPQWRPVRHTSPVLVVA